MTGYRLGHNTDLRVCNVKKISRKAISGQITEQKCYATNAFLWENYLYIYFHSIDSLIVFYMFGI